MFNRLSLTLSIGAVGLGCVLAQANPALAAPASPAGDLDNGQAFIFLTQSGGGASGGVGGASPNTGGMPGMGGAGPGRNDSTGATKQDGRDHSFQGGSGHSGNAMTQDPATTKRPDPSQRR